ncbi:hypothetical protein ACPCTO_32030 [Streptomyces olivoreticuli]
MLKTPVLSDLRISVLYGGESPERPGSIASGEAALKSLTAQGANAELIDLTGIDLGGLHGRIDVALIASHGPGGEDGKLQGALDTLGIPYTGSGVLASAIGMDKVTTKHLLRAEEIVRESDVVLVKGANALGLEVVAQGLLN